MLRLDPQMPTLRLIGRRDSGSPTKWYGVVDDRGRCQTTDFLDDYEKRYPAYVKKMYARLELEAKCGPNYFHDETICRHGGDGVYEMKAGKLRLFWFRDPFGNKLIVATHVWEKATKKEQQRQFDRAKEMRRQYQHSPFAVEVMEEDDEDDSQDLG